MDEQPANKPDTPAQQSVLAIIAGVLGLLSLFLGFLTGVPAVILGHIAFTKVGRSEGRLKGKGLAIFALVTGYIAIAIFVFNRMR